MGLKPHLTGRIEDSAPVLNFDKTHVNTFPWAVWSVDYVKGYLNVGRRGLMTVTVDATYENGALRLLQPLPLREHQKVRVSIEVEPSLLLRAYGMMGWKGDAETIERIALGPDFDPLGE